MPKDDAGPPSDKGVKPDDKGPSLEELAMLDAEDVPEEVEEGTLLDEDSDVVNEKPASDAKLKEVAVDLAKKARGPERQGRLVKATDPEGILPELTVGDDAGYASLVVRVLGHGDGTVYGEREARRVLQLQRQFKLQETGTMTPETWAHLLPHVEVGTRGPVVMVLRAVLGVPGPPLADQALIDAAGAAAPRNFSGKVGRMTWLQLLL